MKVRVFLSLFSFSILLNYSHAQTLTMSQLEGIWKYTPGNVGINAEEDFDAYAIQKNHKRLFITFWKKPQTTTSNLEYWALFNGENQDFKHISDLTNVGDHFFSIDQKCVDEKTNEFLCAGRSTKIGFENLKTIENEATKFYLHWHQKPDDYTKVNNLPNDLLNRMKSDEKLWKQYLTFETNKSENVAIVKNADKEFKSEKEYKYIKVPKSTIYKSQMNATRMYFVKGDKIEVLDKKPGWVKFRFFNKRTIEGWVKESDTE